MGRIDPPHLIRIHHLNLDGVYLRDVKRWLADLRGKDMPEAFAWSYKRTYKTGYVWQDLVDDDLITPISDNEYVLKGSEIISSPFDSSPPKSISSSNGEKRSGLFKEQPVKDEVEPPNHCRAKQDEAFQLHEQHPEMMMMRSENNIQTKVPASAISQESSSPPHMSLEMRSSLTRELFDAMKSRRPPGENHVLSADDETLKPNTNTNTTNNNVNYDDDHIDQSHKLENSSFYSNFLILKKMKKKNWNKEMASTTPSYVSSSSSSHSSSSCPHPHHQSPLANGGTTKTSNSSRSSSSSSNNIFRNLLTCGAVDTNDSVLVMLNRETNNKTTTSCSNKSTCNMRGRSSQDIIKADRISKGVFGGIWNPQEQLRQPEIRTGTATRKSYIDGETDSISNKGEQKERDFTRSQKPASAAYRPVGGPHCSQCRKMFKPEKLHSHMKSCKGMKPLKKTSRAASVKLEQIPEMGSKS